MSAIGSGPFIALQTYRKNGEKVNTPVWVCEIEGALYIWTDVNSWKVKRIRKRSDVDICESDMRGNPKGEWVSSTAIVRDDPTINKLVRKAMIKKYGLQFHMMELTQKISRTFSPHVAIEIIPKINIS
jgi:hypothetical protein